MLILNLARLIYYQYLFFLICHQGEVCTKKCPIISMIFFALGNDHLQGRDNAAGAHWHWCTGADAPERTGTDAVECTGTDAPEPRTGTENTGMHGNWYTGACKNSIQPNWCIGLHWNWCTRALRRKWTHRSWCAGAVCNWSALELMHWSPRAKYNAIVGVDALDLMHVKTCAP